MFGLHDFSLKFLSGTPLLGFAALAAAIGLTIWLYLRTNPPISPFMRIVLASLRALAMLSLVGALLQPVLGFSRNFERKPRVAMLLDRSGSMEKVENTRSRTTRLDSLLSGENISKIKSEAQVTTYDFADRLSGSDTAINTERTAIGDVIRQLSAREMEQPSEYWLLFSDGNSNAGRQPKDAAIGLGTPIHSIDLSLSAGGFDVSVEKVDFNPVVFVGQPTDVKVTIGWQGADRAPVSLQLRESARQLATTSYQITQNGGFADLTLRYTPAAPGQMLLTVTVPAGGNEETDANNSRTISVRVLKSRLSVLIYAEHPDYETSFLQRSLRSSNKYDLTLCIPGNKAGNLSKSFPSTQSELNRYDAIIFCDPSPGPLQSSQSLIKSYLTDRGGGILFLMNEQYSQGGTPPWLGELLPFAPNARRSVLYADFHAEPNEGQLFHPAIRLEDDRGAIRDRWNSMPPFRGLVRCDAISSEATILANAILGSDSTKLPALGFRRHGPGKVIASSVFPFWHWKFIQKGMGQDDSYYDKFVEGVMSWLTVPENADPIRIYPEREVFSRGEEIRFQGVAFDQGLRPIEAAEGSIKLTGIDASVPFETDLIDRKRGTYEAAFKQVPPGTYKWEGKLLKGGTELKKSHGTIHVESFSLEESRRGGDPATLTAVSQATGGSYVSLDQFADFSKKLTLSPIIEAKTGEFRLWGQSWLLYVCLGLLALEWVVRKMLQLL